MTELLVAALVAASTLGGVWLTQRSERKRAETSLAAQVDAERRQDERQLRDAKRERVRLAYTDLLLTARLVLQRAKAMGWLSEAVGLNEQADQVVELAFADLERSLAGLLLESDAQEVVAIFEATLKAFTGYRIVFARGIQRGSEAGEKPYTALRDALIEMEYRVPELEAAARRHLSSLEEPI